MHLGAIFQLGGYMCRHISVERLDPSIHCGYVLGL